MRRSVRPLTCWCPRQGGSQRWGNYGAERTSSRIAVVLGLNPSHKCLVGLQNGTHTNGSNGLDLEHHLQLHPRRHTRTNWVYLTRVSPLWNDEFTFMLSLDRLHVLQVATKFTNRIKQDLRKWDIKFRKFVRATVGPPGGIDWSGPWIRKYRTSSASKCHPGHAWNHLGNLNITLRTRGQPAAC